MDDYQGPERRVLERRLSPVPMLSRGLDALVKYALVLYLFTMSVSAIIWLWVLL